MPFLEIARECGISGAAIQQAKPDEIFFCTQERHLQKIKILSGKKGGKGGSIKLVLNIKTKK
jgi:hypothetical protein